MQSSSPEENINRCQKKRGGGMPAREAKSGSSGGDEFLHQRRKIQRKFGSSDLSLRGARERHRLGLLSGIDYKAGNGGTGGIRKKNGTSSPDYNSKKAQEKKKNGGRFRRGENRRRMGGE